MSVYLFIKLGSGIKHETFSSNTSIIVKISCKCTYCVRQKVKVEATSLSTQDVYRKNTLLFFFTELSIHEKNNKKSSQNM